MESKVKKWQGDKVTTIYLSCFVQEDLIIYDNLF